MSRKPLSPEFVRVVAHFGVSGSGKTFALEIEALVAWRKGATVFVIDPHREISPPIEHALVRNVAEAARALADGWRFIIMQAPEGVSLGHERAVEWALKTKSMLIVVPECHRYWPAHARPKSGMDDASSELLTAYRHYNLGLLADSQRISAVSKTLTEQAAVIRVFACVGSRDLSTLEEISVGLSEAAKEAARRFGAKPPMPGWHALVDMRTRLGPWTLERLRAPT